MSRPESEFLGGIIAGLHWRDAAARVGLSEERALAFLESVKRFASSVGDVIDFGTVTAADVVRSGGSPTARPSMPKTSKARLVVFTDGASLGNPGDAGAGATIATPDGETVGLVSEYVGRTTNNVAEYEAVRLGLETAIAHGARCVDLRLDSELVARQLTGRYKVRDPKLQEKYLQVAALMARLEDISIVHVPREQNAEADRLAKRGAKRGIE
jgi:ribonuclease HI